MPQWQIQQPSSLGHALRGQGVAQWKIPVLIDSGAIQVFRGNTQLTLRGEATHVRMYDLVRLLDPLPAAATAALQKAADSSCRDYALVTGTSPYDKEMARLLDARPETIRVKNPLLLDLARFVTALGTSREATHPIRHLLPASHGNEEGHFWLRVGSMNRGIDYGDLVALVASKAIVIDDKMLEPRPTDPKTKAPIPARFIMRGCRIGHKEKFVRKLKEALGNKTPVAAPLHFHLATPIRKPHPGHIEYLAYSFEYFSPTRVKDRRALITAMAGKAFPRIDKKPVPSKFWDDRKVIPDKLHLITDPRKQQGEQTFHSEAKSPLDGRKRKLVRTYRYKYRTLLDSDNRVEVPGQSTKEADRLKAARAQLEKIDFFEEKTGFPVYERYGYTSIDEFMKGWTWVFKPETKSQFVTYNAHRHEYRVIEPIAELQKGKRVKPGEFILNFYPTRPSKRAKPFEALVPDDDRLYRVV